MKYLYLYILTFLVFLAIDFVWLRFIAKDLYAQKIGHLLAESPNLVPALVFYLIFVVGTIIFAILPGYESQSLVKTLLLGGFFGMLSYATYDLTNLATLRDWPLSVTIIDIIWGTSLSAITSLAGYYIANMLNV